MEGIKRKIYGAYRSAHTHIHIHTHTHIFLIYMALVVTGIWK